MTKYSNPTSTVPVLIAGAGPAGLAAAITLARYGVESLVVDPKQELSPMPRASLVSTGSMELFRSWGLEPAVTDAAIDVRFTGFLGNTLRDRELEFPVGVPSSEQAAVVAPNEPLCVTVPCSPTASATAVHSSPGTPRTVSPPGVAPG
jgi:putative polyketide hydroxylase